MKKIIDGMRYDTKRAEEVASWSNGYYGSDFKRCAETLYRTKRGNWFLCGEGGPMSKYAEQHGNSYCGGSDLKPLSADEARDWLEERGCFDELEEHFSDQVEDA